MFTADVVMEYQNEIAQDSSYMLAHSQKNVLQGGGISDRRYSPRIRSE